MFIVMDRNVSIVCNSRRYCFEVCSWQIWLLLLTCAMARDRASRDLLGIKNLEWINKNDCTHAWRTQSVEEKEYTVFSMEFILTVLWCKPRLPAWAVSVRQNAGIVSIRTANVTKSEFSVIEYYWLSYSVQVQSWNTLFMHRYWLWVLSVLYSFYRYVQ